MTPEIELISGDSIAKVEALLVASNLPAEDLRIALATGERMFFGIRDPLVSEAYAGVVGVELFASSGLLRSLVVRPDRRGTGYASRLTSYVEQEVTRHRIRELYLLTTTATLFFEARGYEVVARGSAPDAIRNTSEFSSLCPDSADLMLKRCASK